MKPILISLIIASLIGLYPVLPNSVLGQEQAAPAVAPATQQAGATATGEKAWPRRYTTPSGAAVVIYQPQVASWEDQKHIIAYAAVSVLAGAETEKPALGTVKIEGDTAVA